MSESWIRIPRPNPAARIRLFCLHPAGKGASFFIPWSALFPSEIEICAIQLPGREDRQNILPYRRMQPLIDDLQEALFPVLDRSFAIFGASLGALIGFELSRSLRRSYGVQPVQFFAASSWPPLGPWRLPPISSLPDDLFLQELQHRYGGIAGAIARDKEIQALFLPVLRADFEILETYACPPGDLLDCPTAFLYGLDDRAVLKEDQVGWERVCRLAIQASAFQGGHFFFYDRPAETVEWVSNTLAHLAY
jgi:medium-chain acyl-[acyl-carrier-protein] hydrolase